jgi:hypothetical protein
MLSEISFNNAIVSVPNDVVIDVSKERIAVAIEKSIKSSSNDYYCTSMMGVTGLIKNQITDCDAVITADLPTTKSAIEGILKMPKVGVLMFTRKLNALTYSFFDKNITGILSPENWVKVLSSGLGEGFKVHYLEEGDRLYVLITRN